MKRTAEMIVLDICFLSVVRFTDFVSHSLASQINRWVIFGRPLMRTGAEALLCKALPPGEGLHRRTRVPAVKLRDGTFRETDRKRTGARRL